MRKHTKLLFKIYLGLFVLFTIGFWILMIVDDYVLMKDHWSDHWMEYLTIWGLYYLVYLLFGSFLYWLLGMAFLLIVRLITRNASVTNNE